MHKTFDRWTNRYIWLSVRTESIHSIPPLSNSDPCQKYVVSRVYISSCRNKLHRYITNQYYRSLFDFSIVLFKIEYLFHNNNKSLASSMKQSLHRCDTRSKLLLLSSLPKIHPTLIIIIVYLRLGRSSH